MKTTTRGTLSILAGLTIIGVGVYGNTTYVSAASYTPELRRLSELHMQGILAVSELEHRLSRTSTLDEAFEYKQEVLQVAGYLDEYHSLISKPDVRTAKEKYDTMKNLSLAFGGLIGLGFTSLLLGMLSVYKKKE